MRDGFVYMAIVVGTPVLLGLLAWVADRFTRTRLDSLNVQCWVSGLMVLGLAGCAGAGWWHDSLTGPFCAGSALVAFLHWMHVGEQETMAQMSPDELIAYRAKKEADRAKYSSTSM